MNREHLLQICRSTRPVGQVKHEDFVDYVVVMTRRAKVNDEWVNTEAPYMSVDGKLAMANEDHRLQNKKLDIGPASVLIDTDTELTLQVGITSEVYGMRYGIATSRKVDGTTAERQFPWEVAETSAIGRALGGFGYGLFPGSGLASADDMRRAEGDGPRGSRKSANTANAATNGATNGTTNGRRNPLSPTQRAKILELTTQLTGETGAESERIADSQFQTNFQHGLKESTYEEGAKQIAFLMQNLKAG